MGRIRWWLLTTLFPEVRCIHEMRPIRVQHVETSNPFGSVGKITILLSVCKKCSAPSTDHFPGTWSIDDLLGKGPHEEMHAAIENLIKPPTP